MQLTKRTISAVSSPVSRPGVWVARAGAVGGPLSVLVQLKETGALPVAVPADPEEPEPAAWDPDALDPEAV